MPFPRLLRLLRVISGPNVKPSSCCSLWRAIAHALLPLFSTLTSIDDGCERRKDAHVCIHFRVHEPEREGFISHERLKAKQSVKAEDKRLSAKSKIHGSHGSVF